MRLGRALGALLVAGAAVLGIGGVAIAGTEPAPVQVAHCVSLKDSKQVLSHKVDGHMLELTLSGELPLCQKLNVVAALYEYTSPDESFPQSLMKVTEVTTIQKPGHYNIAAPAGCGQWDWYAGVGEDVPNPPKVLKAPGDDEPRFLDEFSSGARSFGFDGPGRCIKPPTIRVEQCCEQGKANVQIDVTNPNSFAAWFAVKLGDQWHEKAWVKANSTVTVDFNDVPNGTYKLVVMGPGEKTVTDTVTVDCTLPKAKVGFTDTCDGVTTDITNPLRQETTFTLYQQVGQDVKMVKAVKLKPGESSTVKVEAQKGLKVWWQVEKLRVSDIHTWEQPKDCTTPPTTTTTPPPPPTTPGNNPPAPQQPVQKLAYTGADTSWLLPLAGVLVMLGGGVLLLTRRRRGKKAAS